MGHSRFEEIGKGCHEEDLKALRTQLKEHHLDGWWIPMADPFQNECVRPL